MQGWFDLFGLVTYQGGMSARDGHPSQYQPGSTLRNFVHAMNNTLEFLDGDWMRRDLWLMSVFWFYFSYCWFGERKDILSIKTCTTYRYQLCHCACMIILNQLVTFIRIFAYKLATYWSTDNVTGLQNALYCVSCRVSMVCFGIPRSYRVRDRVRVCFLAVCRQLKWFVSMCACLCMTPCFEAKCLDTWNNLFGVMRVITQESYFVLDSVQIRPWKGKTFQSWGVGLGTFRLC